MRKKRYALYFLLMGMIASVIFLSCASKPKFNGTADLCGLVVDEENRPVSNFLILCDGAGGLNFTALTNESGIFVVKNLTCGNYQISGHKTNYQKLEKIDYAFYDRTKIFCCQVYSFDAALESVSNLMLRGENKAAEKMLEEISFEPSSNEAAVINFYRFYLTESSKDRMKIIAKLRKLSNLKQNDFSDFADTLEEYIYED